MPQKISADIEQLHVLFKDTYPGLPEFSTENPYLTLQMRHIFYPSLQPKLDVSCQFIKEFKLNGFHHDEYTALEQSGLFTLRNQVYGESSFGAQECISAVLDWGDGIITEGLKTFFPSSWSREKTAQVIFEAAQNRIKDLSEIGSPHKTFLCQVSNLFIEIVINRKNVIISAYPSERNFRM